MIAEPGHLAMILPRFAADPVIAREIGLYRYLGGYAWHTLKPSLFNPTLVVQGGRDG
jgi:hypothetical protein